MNDDPQEVLKISSKVWYPISSFLAENWVSPRNLEEKVNLKSAASEFSRMGIVFGSSSQA